MFRVISLASYSEDLFGGRVFCSPKCLRAFCLESLETLDALDTPAAASVVRDLHGLRHEVHETLIATAGAT